MSDSVGLQVSGAQQPVAADDGDGNGATVQSDSITLTIAGREVTVRPYGFTQGLSIRPMSRDLVRDLMAQVRTGEALTEDILDVLARHDATVRELMLLATEGADADWLDGLNEDDGTALMLTWWGVCGPIFVRQIMRRIYQSAEAVKALAVVPGAPAAMPLPDNGSAANAP